uniref:Uncharacterized protein n=1 Tax=Chromera velia CCMP2878 TaxID=1169474 RepID=A0A0G4F9J8_9ALVE|eukprot:Cvel_15773.t1-p1 / transcript=Cvel_15773.t1 / gene=Cvel_15773 / organism=Chromera_velia_CCMP2878 / gene_product=hypothetical protein / transcript_product=hypothetical protein / location=Cvel_scaffold1183:5671-9265(+) / protein_length=848 / sequence_SO=supercontig / SO=protein_coding / is_pseudo=false
MSVGLFLVLLWTGTLAVLAGSGSAFLQSVLVRGSWRKRGRNPVSFFSTRTNGLWGDPVFFGDDGDGHLIPSEERGGRSVLLGAHFRLPGPEEGGGGGGRDGDGSLVEGGLRDGGGDPGEDGGRTLTLEDVKREIREYQAGRKVEKEKKVEDRERSKRRGGRKGPAVMEEGDWEEEGGVRSPLLNIQSAVDDEGEMGTVPEFAFAFSTEALDSFDEFLDEEDEDDEDKEESDEAPSGEGGRNGFGSSVLDFARSSVDSLTLGDGEEEEEEEEDEESAEEEEKDEDEGERAEAEMADAERKPLVRKEEMTPEIGRQSAPKRMFGSWKVRAGEALQRATLSSLASANRRLPEDLTRRLREAFSDIRQFRLSAYGALLLVCRDASHDPGTQPLRLVPLGWKYVSRLQQLLVEVACPQEEIVFRFSGPLADALEGRFKSRGFLSLRAMSRGELETLQADPSDSPPTQSPRISVPPPSATKRFISTIVQTTGPFGEMTVAPTPRGGLGSLGRISKKATEVALHLRDLADDKKKKGERERKERLSPRRSPLWRLDALCDDEIGPAWRFPSDDELTARGLPSLTEVWSEPISEDRAVLAVGVEIAQIEGPQVRSRKQRRRDITGVIPVGNGTSGVTVPTMKVPTPRTPEEDRKRRFSKRWKKGDEPKKYRKENERVPALTVQVDGKLRAFVPLTRDALLSVGVTAGPGTESLQECVKALTETQVENLALSSPRVASFLRNSAEEKGVTSQQDNEREAKTPRPEIADAPTLDCSSGFVRRSVFVPHRLLVNLVTFGGRGARERTQERGEGVEGREKGEGAVGGRGKRKEAREGASEGEARGAVGLQQSEAERRRGEE